MNFRLSEEEQRQLLELARHELDRALLGAPEKNFQPTEPIQKPLACFVTLLSPRGRLRGCIGCLETEFPLHENVRRFARKAAFDDPRFKPLTPTELPGLQLKIAVLAPPRKLVSWDEVVIGRHGLCVTDPQQRRRGVLLASVAVEWEWDTQNFRDQTCVKAGLDPARHHTYVWEYFEEFSFST